MVYVKIGSRIKERRKALNMPIEVLAKKINKNRATVYRYESGYIENLPLNVLKPLCEALDCSIAYLLDTEEKN